MTKQAVIDEIERMRPAERLRYHAEAGYKIRRVGPVEEDFVSFVDRMVSSGWVQDVTQLSQHEPGYMSHEAFREEVHLMHTLGRWAHFGFNVFDLSEGLASALLLTEPAPVPEQGLKLPFPAFFIKLPPGIVPMFLFDRQVWAEGIWVHQFVSKHRERGTITFVRWTAVHGAVAVWKDRFPTDIDDPEDETLFNSVHAGDPPSVPEDQITMSNALRVIKNLVYWLSSTGGLEAHPKPEPPHVKRKGSKDKQKIVDSGAWPHVWVFGKGVKLHGDLQRAARDVALGGSTKHAPEGWQVRVRHWVRGSWKQQPYGEGRALRKLIWVHPYQRGPEGAEGWAHMYQDDGAP